MSFTQPLALLLLLTLAYFLWLAWPRGRFAWRDRVSLVLRGLLVALLVFGLAGAQTVHGGDELAVVFLVDVSDSIGPAGKATELDFVRQALDQMTAKDQAAIVLFGQNALVERRMSPVKQLAEVTSVPNPRGTDLAAAIRLALALFPPGAARRIVVLSDGGVTSGQTLDAAMLTAASGAQMDIAPILGVGGPEALLTNVSAPARMHQNEDFTLDVSVQSNQATSATLRVLAGGTLVAENSIALNKGANSFAVPMKAGRPGFTTFRVQLAPARDTYYQNNELAAFSEVSGPPRVLIVDGMKDGRPEATPLANALTAAGLAARTTTPLGLPTELTSLADWAAIVLVDVPARSLSPRQMLALQTYVRDLGRGLIAIGGPQSYGVGGYYRTPLEETLPVEMQIKDKQRMPPLALVFVIDKSGSMSASSGGAVKIELAKEAVLRSFELLNPTDHVGVVAFDENASWVLPIAELGGSDASARVGTLRAGGGTDIYAGLKAVADVLPSDPAAVKHIVLLTDGGANPANISELVKKLHDENNITLSAVGVGDDAAPWLQDLPPLGGGRYHFTRDPSTIPAIFTEETMLAARAYIIEEAFFPKLTATSPILSGIASAPQLLGYVATSFKSTAQTILVSAREDPVLAAWQYGLGRSVAWTSDATGRWAQPWVTWGDFTRFWAQAVRWTIRDEQNQTAELTVQAAGSRATLTLDAQDSAGQFLNGLSVTTTVIGPSRQTQEMPLRQTAPGRYSADFMPAQEGAYLVQATSEQFSITSGWVNPYSPEYRSLGGNPGLLQQIASVGQGRLLNQPAEAFAHTIPATPTTRDIWPMLLTLVALLLPFDVAARRLMLGPRDLARLLDAIRKRWPGRKPLGETAPRVARLMSAKERAATARPAAPPVEAAPPRAEEPAPSPPSPAPAPGALADRLLEAKKRARRGVNDENKE